MKATHLITVAGFLLSLPALAQDAPAEARAEVRAALIAKADAPNKLLTLPTHASDDARDVHATTAFGEKGEEQRNAHGQAVKSAADDGTSSRADAANRSAQGAATSAAKSANGDANSAAGQNRAAAAKAAHPHPSR